MAPKTQKEAVEQAKEIFAGDTANVSNKTLAETKEHLPSTNVLDPNAGQFIDGKEDTITPPQLKLMQGQSDEVKSGRAKVGEFWFTGTEVTIPQPFTIVPFLVKRQWVSFLDGKLDFRTDSKLAAMEKWGDEAFRYDSFVFLVYIREINEVAGFRLKGMSIGVARKLLNAGMGKKHMSCFAFELKSEKGQNKYGNPVVVARNLGASTEDEQKLAAHIVKTYSPMFNTAKLEESHEQEGKDDAPF